MSDNQTSRLIINLECQQDDNNDDDDVISYTGDNDNDDDITTSTTTTTTTTTNRITLNDWTGVRRRRGRSSDKVKSPCTVCFGYMEKIDRYLNEWPYDYSDTFTARFPWEIKNNIFKPLLNYIVTLSRNKQTNHHYIYDLTYLNAIFDCRYVNTHYSFAYALEEYDYMMKRLQYVCCFLDNDQYMTSQIQLLEEGLALEITRAQMGYFYRPCSCGSKCMSNEEFSKKTSCGKKSFCKKRS